MNPPKLHIYLIRDERANRYGTPIFSGYSADVMADSYRSAILSKPEEAVGLVDSVLYEVGTFDTLTGEIQEVPVNQYELVCRMSDFFNEAVRWQKSKAAEMQQEA